MYYRLTMRQVQAAVAKIAGVEDFERQHDLEDRLYRRVLRHIADCKCQEDPAVLARAALQTQELSFPRVYS